jgi:hypothetical protein
VKVNQWTMMTYLSRSRFITPRAFVKLGPNGRKIVRGEPVEASNHALEGMTPALGMSVGHRRDR